MEVEQKRTQNLKVCGWIGLDPTFRKLAVIDEMQKSPIEKRKRNLKTISPHSRGEREI